MALRDWQIALTTRIAMPTPVLRDMSEQQAWWHTLDLTPAELAWCEQAMDSPGMQLTCNVQRWWRQMRLQSSLRFTLAVLPPEQRLSIIQAYITSEPCMSLFFVPEALQFLDFVLQATPTVPYVDVVARFERALFQVKEAQDALLGPPQEIVALLPTQHIGCHPAAALILFPTPPEFLLSALLQGTTLPIPDGQPYPVLIASGIPRLWRQATAEEARLFTLCQETLTVAQIAAEQPGLSTPLQTLLAARALCVE